MITFDSIEAMRDSEKSLDSQLWHACAGSMVQMPSVHFKVYFFPQGYIEHASSSSSDLPSFSSSCPNRIPPLLLCRVQSIKYLADPDSDEVFSKIRLVPTRSDTSDLSETEEDDSVSDLSEKDGNKPVSFAKTLTQSDANNGGGFSVPRYCAETIFPRLDYTADPPVQTVLAKDVHGEIWKFRHIYRGTPRRHLLTTGWSTFVNNKKLVAGDSIVFLRVESGDLHVGIRRAKRGGIGSPDPFPPLSNYAFHNNPNNNDRLTRDQKGRIKMESVIEAVNLATSGRGFEVIYYPRASTPEFVVRAGAVRAAMRVGWGPGMRFKMPFETEDSSRISWFMGTINSVQVADPVRWPSSPWRLLQVTWDEPDLLQNVKRVSPWLVELVSSIPPIHLSPPFPSLQPAAPMAARKRPRLIPLEGQPQHTFSFHPLPFGGNAIYPSVSGELQTGIQGARQPNFGVSLPDHLSLFGPQFFSRPPYPNPNPNFHHQQYNHNNNNNNNHNNVICDNNVNNNNNMIVRDDVSCLLTLGTPNGMEKSGKANPDSEGNSNPGKPKQLVLFGKPILTEDLISTSNNSGNLSDGSGSSSVIQTDVKPNTVSANTGFGTAGICKVFMESEDLGRTMELSCLGSYEELYEKLGQMFGVARAELVSRVLYQNTSGEVRRTGDDSFGEFVKSTRRITILTDAGSDNLDV
ncbi:hypothetical protein LUZ60_016503 [Juncus effusus]|nr:hypothetical protein LUZ60_016503 [Juncus effusus]